MIVNIERVRQHYNISLGPKDDGEVDADGTSYYELLKNASLLYNVSATSEMGTKEPMTNPGFIPEFSVMCVGCARLWSV